MTVPALEVHPVPNADDALNDIRQRTAAIVNELILPNERELLGGEPCHPRAVITSRVKKEVCGLLTSQSSTES